MSTKQNSFTKTRIKTSSPDHTQNGYVGYESYQCASQTLGHFLHFITLLLMADSTVLQTNTPAQVCLKHLGFLETSTYQQIVHSFGQV